MAKDLKINIKNLQLAKALKIKKAPAAAAAPKKKAESEHKAESDALKKKPKIRILPPVEKKEKEPEEVIAATVETPVVIEKTEPFAEPIKEEAAPVSTDNEEIAVTVKPEEKAKEETPAKKPKELESIKETPDDKNKKGGFKETRPAPRKSPLQQTFDAQDRMGLRASDEGRWRKRRFQKHKRDMVQQEAVRPRTLSIKLPISLKDLASELKLKASELIAKLFMQGIVITLNDFLDDETTVQLLGSEFGCEITIDTSEEKKLRITEENVNEEIKSTPTEQLIARAPVVTFMGHVDHGKTSIIDAIRSSNVAAGEAGAITQHISAFSAQTPYGEITILDTPGHEAFSEMRSRGAIITDLIVLVIAGDEGIREQTREAIEQARSGSVPIIVALNKSDKAGYDPEKVYRQLADEGLLPEAWGGTIITASCSAATKKGIPELLEMIALQAEVLELKANPKARARGAIIESQMHKGLGNVATVLVQNGTLKTGDAIVFGTLWGRIKTIHDQNNKTLKEAGPSKPVKITGLSDLATAGSEFIVVGSEKEARDLATARAEGESRQRLKQTRGGNIEKFLQTKKETKARKILTLILRADVQGSIEALKNSLMKIHSDKIELNIISEDIGEISESDMELAAASKGVIIGFHTRVENHAEPLIKRLNVKVRQHNIIYHVIDDVKELMRELLDKVEQENDTGKAEVKNIFKSSSMGLIAGCLITDGIIKRGQNIRIMRGGKQVRKGKIISLKRVKEDVKEVLKGVECGIILDRPDIQVNDIFEAYDINYIEQEL